MGVLGGGGGQGGGRTGRAGIAIGHDMVAVNVFGCFDCFLISLSKFWTMGRRYCCAVCMVEEVG